MCTQLMSSTTSTVGRLALFLAWSQLGHHCCQFSAAIPVANAENTEQENDSSSSFEEDECQLYLAPSTIPGAGLGIFAGVDFDAGDLITYGDIVVPIVDIPFHIGATNYGEGYSFLWEEYSWDSPAFPGIKEDFDGVVEDVEESIQMASMGIGAMPNCNFGLTNIVASSRSTLHDASTLDRRSPGNGAFTPYHGREGKAYVPIGAGWELFEHYGTSYFDTRADVYGAVPRNIEDYNQADGITGTLNRFRRKYKEKTPIRFIWDLYHLIKDFPWDSPVLSALPKLPLAEENADANQNLHFDYLLKHGARMYARSQTIRSPEWLRKHGQCMDLIRPGDSTIPHAGRGAFATRFIPKGGKIAPMPLIHIPDRNMLTMYQKEEIFHAASDIGNEHRDIVEVKGYVEESLDPIVPEDWIEIRRNVNAPIHKQLLINYCFGHRNFTALLSPYGSVTSLVNHGLGSDANARIAWGKDWMRNSEWLDEPPEMWVNQSHSGLGFDLIAMRDIQPDEEILLDYGDEFDLAWKKHVEQWDHRDPRYTGTSFPYIPAKELNNNIEQVLFEAVDKKIDYSFAGRGVHLWCYQRGKMFDDETTSAAGEDEAQDPATQGMESVLRQCRPIQIYPGTRNGQALFTAEIVSWVEVEDPPKWTLVVEDIQFSLPSSVFVFTDEPHTRAIQELWSFRHEMMIPDDIMPEAWLNKEKMEPQTQQH